MSKIITKEEREKMAKAVITLVRDHRKTCEIKDCEVDMKVLKKLYENFIGREITRHENLTFI